MRNADPGPCNTPRGVRHTDGREETPFSDKGIVYIEDSKEYSKKFKKLSKLINIFIKFTESTSLQKAPVLYSLEKKNWKIKI